MIQINFREDGQGYIDFDYLANLTSVELVATIQLTVRNSDNYRIVVQSASGDAITRIFVTTSGRGFIDVYNYYHSSGVYTESAIFYPDLDIIKSLFEVNLND